MRAADDLEFIELESKNTSGVFLFIDKEQTFV